MELLKINQAKCSQCGICTKVCPVGILDMGEKGPEAIQPQACIACGHCVAACPHGALDNIKTPFANQTSLQHSPVLTADTAEQFLRSRRSIRCYRKDGVPREKLLKLIDIARFAPTASNQQGLSYTIVENKEILEKATAITIAFMEQPDMISSHWSFPYHIRAYREKGIDKILRDAPHLILATAPKEFSRGRENTLFSLAYLELYAPTLGLGSCWAGLLEMCLFAKHEPLLELFSIPEGQVITGAVMVGYPLYSYKRLVDRNPLRFRWL